VIYSEDEYVGSITSTKANRYVKKYDKEYLISSVDKQNNMYEIIGELSKDPKDRKAITFHGLEVRPGSIIDKTVLEVNIEKEITLNIVKNRYGIIGKINYIFKPYISEFIED
jgi:replicative DNA helicase